MLYCITVIACIRYLMSSKERNSNLILLHMIHLSNFTRIKRTIQALNNCYPNQSIDKETVLNCLQNAEFQAIYINY